MNEKFFSLDPEKQKGIMDAGFKVFSRYDYKHASTDEITQEAGISKGLLFHYFESKRSYYLYLFDYALKYIRDRFEDIHDYEKTDFFEIITDAQLAKIDIMHEHPDLTQFVVTSYLENHEEVEQGIAENFGAALDMSMESVLERVDRSKFKTSITAEQAWNVVVWMSEGFMKRITPDELKDIEALNDRFLKYVELLRRHFYREEYA